jgi:hypothetical protein
MGTIGETLVNLQEPKKRRFVSNDGESTGSRTWSQHEFHVTEFLAI